MKTPWQYEWKRPKLEELQAEDSYEGAMDVTAALVAPKEVAKSSPTPLLLTVTLYSDNGLLGNRLLVNLIDPPSSQQLQSRELRWPGSMLDDEHTGIVSVELCRKSSLITSVASVDALDVINLMSLGIVDTSSRDASSRDISSNGDAVEDEAVRKSLHIQEVEPSERSDLVLACLTLDGRVHLYKALDLLNQSIDDDDDSDEDEIEVGLANLLLGSVFYKQIQQSLYPLSKPYGTVQLSIPLEPKKSQKPKFSLPFFNKKQEGIDIRLWDESFWNSTVEKSTAVHRTLRNVPTGMVSVFQYMAVFGRGSRIRRLRTKQEDDFVVVEGMEALQDNNEAAQHDEAQEQKTNEWWQGEKATDDAMEQDRQEPWWKAGGGDEEVVETVETGGFVTFIDLHHASETRTLYLPFAPKGLYPLFWGDMAFVIVLADETTTPDRTAKAIAIRVDSSNKVYFDCGASPTSPAQEEMEMIGSDGILVKKPACEVRRFSLIPIMLPVDDQLSSTTIRTTTASSLLSSPPSIELMYTSQSSEEGSYDVALTLNSLQYFDVIPPSDLFSYPHYAKSSSSVAVIRTMQRVGNAARMPQQFDENDIESAWSRAFQGCSLFSMKQSTYFVCWDGATEDNGAYVQELVDHDRDLEDINLNCMVLPLEHSNKTSSNLARELYVTSDDGESSERDLKLPFTSEEVKSIDEPPDVEGIVIDALDSISSLSYRGSQSLLSPISSPKVKRSQRLSYIEKSQRLVQNCDTWSTLGDTKANRAMFESQVPVLISVLDKRAQVLSLRHRFVKNGDATPFYQVLSWLSQSEDYFTAASIALGLLRDVESWRDLRRLKGVSSDDAVDKRDNLEGLLDGIVPLYPEGSLTLRPRQSVVSQVADMTVGCLAKGGLNMATTLISFVKCNTDYDQAKAGLMLVAVATRCVSRHKETVNSAMGAGYEYSEESKPEDLLWALRSLLCVGVARDQLAQAVVLVNVAMPDELRCRKSKSSATSSPPMDLCKAMVSKIIAASPDAAALMLGLIDEESRKRYWGSLSREAQLEFTLINVEDRSPLLLQAEVRKWALDCLDECVTQESSPSAVNLFDLMPTEWLQRLCEGCLLNAECDYGRILTYGVDDSPVDEDEGTSKYVTEFCTIQKALAASPSSGGLDFDLLIPALLILQHRDVLWNQEAVVSTQRILDAACYTAGRPGPGAFAFDGTKVMQQCAAASNVSAGANLVGGKNGLVLNCCDILMQGAELDMMTAESFVMSDVLSQEVWKSKGRDQDKLLSMTDGHRQVLWLLLEHVLNVRTFGEFHPTHMRGKVDPVFAAQACLRTWLALSASKDSTAWMCNWLRKKLEIDGDQISPKRLACAALTRALMWPTSDQSQDVLATVMGVESTFLVQLAQSCHGLMESVPVSMAEEIIAKTDAPVPSVHPSTRIQFPSLLA